MVQGDINAGVTAVPQNNSPTNTNGNNTNQNSRNPTRLFDDNLNAYMDNGEKKKKVGNYIISKVIGEGSFAKVRLGYHLITQQKVAVKVINKREVLKRNYLRANLRREACMMQRMQHPHIIQLFEVMETENCYYIVMELIDGIEFVKYLSKKRTLDETETRNYIRQIVSAVDHMHKANVIHRDIKLQNFMLDQNFNLVIIDFGLSNCLDEREFLNTQCGSPAYAAPEIFAHQDYREEVDIWSVGVNMYAMLAGKLPFKVENRSKNLAKLHACILKGCEIPSYLSPDCQDLLRKLLDPSPNLRIKMHEIMSHPWLNYHSFPVEIIPYKPVVDMKEIKPHIVKYLVKKHEYTEAEVIDAIVHRKPVALKALYYLVDKRLKQGLTYPEADYKAEEEAQITENHAHGSNTSSSITAAALKVTMNPKNHSSLTSSNLNANTNSNLTSKANNNSALYSLQSAATAPQSTSGSALIKQNSQLLPKRNTATNMVTRASSQKTVDVKFVYDRMTNANRENENPTAPLGRSESALSGKSAVAQSPDFVQQQLNHMKAHGTAGNNPPNTASTNVSRKSNASGNNFHDIVYRKTNPSTTNPLNTSTDSNRNESTTLSKAKSMHNTERYFMPVQSGRSGLHYSPSVTSEDNYNQQYHHLMKSKNAATTAVQNNANGIRSLPGSIYRGSPERSMPRSPEYNNYMHGVNGAASNTRTISRIGSSKPSVTSDVGATSVNDKYYDAQKFKVPNYYVAKRSMTSCDEIALSKSNSSVLKNRQLQMGKAKIELGTQQSKNDFILKF